MARLSPVAIIPALAWAISAAPQSTPSNAPTPPVQSNASGNNTASHAAHLPAGAPVVGVLSTNLDTRHSRLGDRVEVEVTQDLQLGGHVLLTRGSHVTGQITQVSAFSRGEQNAKLEVVFNTVTPKHGAQISTHLVICALAAPPDPSAPAGGFAGVDPVGEHTAVAGKPGNPMNRQLRPESRGVIGLEGVTLLPLARQKPPTSALHSTSQNIHLQKGTEIVLIVVAQ